MKKLITLLVLILAVSACHSKRGLHRQNVAHFYYGDDVLLQPEYLAQITPEGKLRIHFSLSTGDLLYRKDSQGRFAAQARVSCRLMPSYEITEVLDSASVTIEDFQTAPGARIITGYAELTLPANSGNQLLVVAELLDVNRKLTQLNYVDIFPAHPEHRQRFLLLDTAGFIRFNNWLVPGEPVRLEPPPGKGTQMQVRAYFRDFPMATPPYSTEGQTTFEYRPDSSFSVEVSAPVSFDRPGLYHLQFDPQGSGGFTFLVMADDFPLVTRKTDLAPPLRYLTTKNEYASMMGAATADSSKLEVDRFWLKSGGSAERARRLVNGYYERVEEANLMFTSYLEGWKTDRGIIYIIFGPPSYVYRSTAGESWVYGEENSSLSYNFNFIRVENPFSDEDYALERMPAYRYGWGQAIEAWRNGHIYNVKDIKREQDERDQQIRNQRPYFWY